MTRSKAGRRRKQGPRTPSGRLKRDNYPRVVHDRGVERIAVMRERFGVHYNSALGRAYASGLLGPEDAAKLLLDAGKRFAALSERFWQQGRYGCPLGREHRSTAIKIEIRAYPGEEADYEWLVAKANALDAAGARPWLDQLISPIYHDSGPAWLDRLLAGGRHPADIMLRDAAIKALEIIAPKQPKVRIVSQVYGSGSV